MKIIRENALELILISLIAGFLGFFYWADHSKHYYVVTDGKSYYVARWSVYAGGEDVWKFTKTDSYEEAKSYIEANFNPKPKTYTVVTEPIQRFEAPEKIND